MDIQGFYFSFGPSSQTDKNQIGKLIDCDGEFEFKVLTPTELNKFLNDGVIKDINYRRSDNTIGINDVGSSKYDRYSCIYNPRVSINYKAMYDFGIELYESVNRYSGAINNCSNVAASIIGQGSHHLKKVNSIYDVVIPNLYFDSISNLFGMINI